MTPTTLSGMREILQQAVSLSAINEAAKVHASDYASPHHITFTVEGLRNLLSALQKQPEPVKDGVPNAEAAIAYALERWGYRQGTKECIAFYRGACWLQLATPPSLRQQEVPSGWRPIETAPKDGTNIILSNGESVAQGWWMDEPGSIREHRDEDGVYLGQDESEGYMGWMDFDGGMLPEPTHWMPLPPSPTHHQEVKAQSASEAEKGGKEVDRG